jgi:DnaK suppressor protein
MSTRSRFSDKEITDQRERLQAELADVRAQFADIEESSFSADQSDLSGEVAFDEEYADAGSTTFEREKDLSISNNLRDLMEKIERALNRIDAGTYGLCERCGNPIEKARMKALPYAALCLADKQAEERIR